eukprot:m.41632 g.41632  ORF g.41632 m.41632 type:complete len:90 (-) comp10443_c0_seq1:552-821(-)
MHNTNVCVEELFSFAHMIYYNQLIDCYRVFMNCCVKIGFPVSVCMCAWDQRNFVIPLKTTSAAFPARMYLFPSLKSKANEDILWFPPIL